jgi:hypothetical protein
MGTELRRNLLSSVQTLDMQEAVSSHTSYVDYHQYDGPIRLQATHDIVHRTMRHYADSDILSVVENRNTENV